MPVKIVYALVPSWVTSERDGQRHYVPAGELVRLYRLPPWTYRVVGDRPSVPEAIKASERQGLIVLYPDPTGKYALPGREEGSSPEPSSPTPSSAPTPRARAKRKADE